MAQVGFEPRPCWSQARCFNLLTTLPTNHKRNNPVTYLKSFIEDLKKLQTTGMVYHSKNYLVNLACVACDAQARVFVKQVKSYAGYLGCDKCIQSGVHDGKK